MKNLLLTTMIVGASIFGNETKAQLGFSLHVNIGNRPSWGVPGNVNANYYYMPEIDSYYDLSSRQFIYEDEGRWIFASNLPDYYRGYDLNRGYKVVVNEPRPYLRGDYYRQQYRGRYDNYRRNDVYAQRNMRPDYRNDNRFDNRYDNRNNGYDQRGNNNDRFDRGRNDDRRNDQRNDRIENRDQQRPSAPVMNNNSNQPRNDDRTDNRNGNGGVRNAQRRG